MPYATAIQGILGFAEESVYPNCRYSLLHKIIQDATYSSTNEWRYRHPKFFWSRDAVADLSDLVGVQTAGPLPETLRLDIQDLTAARVLLYQEHVVPTGVAIRHLLQLNSPSHEQIVEVLDVSSTVCIVTPSENSRLYKNRMPPQEPEFMRDRWGRYRFPRAGESIRISPYACDWQGSTLVFTSRAQSEIATAP